MFENFATWRAPKIIWSQCMVLFFSLGCLIQYIISVEKLIAVYCCLQTAEMTDMQSVMSETAAADGRREQHAAAAASVSGQGPSLKSLPPQTLPSYPVYKPTYLDVRGNVSDKGRPLSYRWLISHCAEHIHVKPSIVEHYVERLELLHIVPKNRCNYRERKICIALIRRCFKPVAEECGTKRRRNLAPLHANKLM